MISPAFPLLRYALVGLVILSLTMPTCRADVYQKVWGVVSDPLKLGKASSELSDTVTRTLAQLDQLEKDGNTHVTERLEQIRSILKDVVVGSQSTIDLALRDMLALETKVDYDAIDLINRTQCAAIETMNKGREAFADVVSDLGRANPGLYIFGLKIIDLKTKKIEISDPDQAYRAMKKQKVDQLIAETNDGSPAYNILSTYSNLQRMATFTMCSYQNQSAKLVWAQEISDIERLSIPWTYAVRPTLP